MTIVPPCQAPPPRREADSWEGVTGPKGLLCCATCLGLPALPFISQGILLRSIPPTGVQL